MAVPVTFHIPPTCLTCPAPQEGYGDAYKGNVPFILCAQHNLYIYTHKLNISLLTIKIYVMDSIVYILNG